MKNRPLVPVRIWKLPSAPETVLVTTWPFCTRATVAPLTLAPEASVTKPRTGAAWAESADARHNARGGMCVREKRIAARARRPRRGEAHIGAASFPPDR